MACRSLDLNDANQLLTCTIQKTGFVNKVIINDPIIPQTVDFAPTPGAVVVLFIFDTFLVRPRIVFLARIIAVILLITDRLLFV